MAARHSGPQSDPLTAVAGALGRVLALDSVILRRDTPLHDIGCDDVAVLAVYHALVQHQQVTTPAALDLDLTHATVGDLADRLAQATAVCDE